MNKEKEQNIKSLKSWLRPKQVQIRELEKSIEAQELYIKQLKEDLDSGFLIKQKEKEIAEQLTDPSKNLKELELEMLKKEIEFGFSLKQSIIILEDLKIKLKLDEDNLEEIKKKITQAERNHNVEIEKPEEPNKPKTGRSFQ